jgi:hypothetical protein
MLAGSFARYKNTRGLARSVFLSFTGEQPRAHLAFSCFEQLLFCHANHFCCVALIRLGQKAKLNGPKGGLGSRAVTRITLGIPRAKRQTP